MKHIDGYGTKYTVTKEGKVFRGTKEIGLGTNGKYHKAHLVNEDGVKTQHKVHRLVANAFIEKEEGKTQVDHIDGNKLNNSVWNLRWCSNEENQNHRDEQNNSGKEFGFSGNINTPVRIMYNKVEYDSKSHLARELSKIRGATEATLKKRIREVIARNGTLYGFPLKII